MQLGGALNFRNQRQHFGGKPAAVVVAIVEASRENARCVGTPQVEVDRARQHHSVSKIGVPSAEATAAPRHGTWPLGAMVAKAEHQFPERAIRYDSQGPRQDMSNARTATAVRKRGAQPVAHNADEGTAGVRNAPVVALRHHTEFSERAALGLAAASASLEMNEIVIHEPIMEKTTCPSLGPRDTDMIKYVGGRQN